MRTPILDFCLDSIIGKRAIRRSGSFNKIFTSLINSKHLGIPRNTELVNMATKNSVTKVLKRKDTIHLTYKNTYVRPSAKNYTTQM